MGQGGNAVAILAPHGNLDLGSTSDLDAFVRRLYVLLLLCKGFLLVLMAERSDNATGIG